MSLSSVARPLPQEYMRDNRRAIDARDGRLFPFWDGDQFTLALDRTTGEVSRTFRERFADSGVRGLTFHDLRHEATCRLCAHRGPAC